MAEVNKSKELRRQLLHIRTEDLGRLMDEDPYKGQAGHAYLSIDSDGAHVACFLYEMEKEGRTVYVAPLGNIEWTSEHISEVEEKLYDFAKGEGYIKEVA